MKWKISYNHCGHGWQEEFSTFVEAHKYIKEWCGSIFDLISPEGITYIFRGKVGSYEK